MTFTNKEQRAILQCLWQLFGAKPNSDECEFVGNIVSKDWSCKVGKEFNVLEKFSLIHEGILEETHTKHPWICCAIGEDPYESFHCVSQFSSLQKDVFKMIVKACVENHGDTNYKTAMAITLFNNTDVPFAIRGKDFLFDKHNGNQTII